jgi:lipopolysaccharide export LptBFGC system permease protein LptF
MILLGGINFVVQDYVAPWSNQVQDELRSQIRSGGVIVESKNRKVWVANEQRIYSFETVSPVDNASASDNDTAYGPDTWSPTPIRNLTVYEFSDKEPKLQALYHAESALWRSDSVRLMGNVEVTEVSETGVRSAVYSERELAEPYNPFSEVKKKPSHLTTRETRLQIEMSEAEIERRSFGVALQKKYSVAFLPFVISLFTAPFALGLGRKGKAALVGYAVGLWLIFVGMTSTFEQLGLNGHLSPEFAIWAPLVMFSFLGIFLLSRAKT